MKKGNYIAPLLSICMLAFLFSSCSKEGRGDIVSKDIGITAFHTLNIQGPFIVHIISDSTEFVTFKGERKRVETCTALVSDSALTIDGSKHGEWLHPAEATTEVFVHVDSRIRRINVNEDCKILSEGIIYGDEIGIVTQTRSFEAELNLDCRTFYFWNNPNGTHMTLTGNAEELKLWNTGLGSIDASGLNAQYVLVENGAQTDCKVKAVQKLEYSLTSVGNIVYFGNPAIIQENGSTGTGQLIKGD